MEEPFAPRFESNLQAPRQASMQDFGRGECSFPEPIIAFGTPFSQPIGKLNWAPAGEAAAGNREIQDIILSNGALKADRSSSFISFIVTRAIPGQRPEPPLLPR